MSSSTYRYRNDNSNVKVSVLPDIRLCIVGRAFVDVKQARPVPDALDEGTQGVFDEGLVEAAHVRIRLAGVTRNIDERTLQAGKETITFFNKLKKVEAN